MNDTPNKSYTVAELKKLALAWRRKLMRLVPKALAGDEAAIKELDAMLPGDHWACFPPLGQIKGRWPYTRACLGRDLVKTGRVARGREILVSAWSHDHRTAIMSLGGVQELVAVFELVRPADPHIAQLDCPLTVWRGTVGAHLGTGLAWTLDRGKALWFAEDYWPHHGLKGDPVVVERVIEKDDVLAVVGSDEGRTGEDEILLRP